MSRIVVVGGSLAGVSTALRLSKVGHDVTLVERDDRLGGVLRDDETPWITSFPAPFKDLLRKSGRAFDLEFARRGCHLEPAPTPIHTFADGTALPWPTERGEQWHVLAERADAATADRWRDLLDTLAGTWQALRQLGLESELTGRDQVRHAAKALHPWGARTVEDLARSVDHPWLSELVRDTAYACGTEPSAAPAHLASRLVIERTFGRWMMTTDAGEHLSPADLATVLEERLVTRQVDVRTGCTATTIRPDGVDTDRGPLPADAVVSGLRPPTHAALLTFRDRDAARAARLAPALVPARTMAPAARDEPLGERVVHTPAGPIRALTTLTPAGPRTVTTDHTRRVPDPRAGVAWPSLRRWLRMPGTTTAVPTVVHASVAHRGGNEPWAQLLSGALAVYRIHGLLTGEDIRPTNRDYKP